jgi:hypothetical protein
VTISFSRTLLCGVREQLGKCPFGRPKRKREDNIKMNLRKVQDGGEWMKLVQNYT